ncbi:MAG: copper resistance system multicopper oxidase [Pseudomonadota bacterium]
MKHLSRRELLHRTAMMGGAAALNNLLPGWAHSATVGATPPSLPTLTGPDIALRIGHSRISVDGRQGHAVTLNGTVPGPLLRFREGETVRLAVTNDLDEDTSIHWHGLLVPFHMDGVPGVSFPGIRAKETFTYEFSLKQSGTYWYHSHSGLQEAEGHYGPIIIDPAEADPVTYDREHLVVLSDYSFMHPHGVFRRMKQQAGVFNYQRQTIAGLLAGRDQTLKERLEWSRMRMDPTDISDVTGAVLSFLINGHGPRDNWTGLFKAGERVRLRFINAAAQMIFNVRIPGLKMTVVAADGQNVRPTEVDEFQIGNAETYDVIVQPQDEQAYTIVSEAVDRSGMGRATLAPRTGMSAAVPPLRPRPLSTMKDMGMDMSQLKRANKAAVDTQPGMARPKPRGSDLMGDMGGMQMSMRDQRNAPQVKLGPGVQSIAPIPVDRTGEPGQGLESVGHRVLVLKDLIALEPNRDARRPTRALEIRLTGNMERFIWGFDGRRFDETSVPYTFEAGERVRITLVNDTMMAHPIHLHGHFFELVHGPAGLGPRKHTVIVPPGGKVSADITANPGDWAFHCHMLYHMHAGMFQTFSVRPLQETGS